MKVVQLGYGNLEDDAIVELMGKDLALIKHVRSHEGNPRADGEPPLTYHHFSVGGRGFTIDSTDQTLADALMNREGRSAIGTVTLQATSFDKPVLDENQNDTGDITRTKSFRFLGMTTHAEALALAKSQGEIEAAEAKYAPKEQGISQASLTAALTKAMQNISLAQAATAKAEVAEEAGNQSA